MLRESRDGIPDELLVDWGAEEVDAESMGYQSEANILFSGGNGQGSMALGRITFGGHVGPARYGNPPGLGQQRG